MRGSNWPISSSGSRRSEYSDATASSALSVARHVRANAGGPYTLAFNAVYNFGDGTVPTASTAANAVDAMAYFVRTTSEIDCVYIKAFG